MLRSNPTNIEIVFNSTTLNPTWTIKLGKLFHLTPQTPQTAIPRERNAYAPPQLPNIFFNEPRRHKEHEGRTEERAIAGI
ncbi:hypothetical protein H6F39_09185 [Anabaena sp. FACHB-1250]|uniref:hypothetical protein n=1 Tax=Anabaena sp. FACHB-1250 TaxID=2692770 RepID=UPI0016805087|nr:hypothetical protein [Anabaena sp. FACHB-1250]MBD2141532.1 hypothetical protein [Anabaena sp. FACHB-1250]